METNRIEYKKEITKFIEKEIIAFLNYKEGGIIFIGIDNEGNTVGLQNADKDALVLKDKIKNNISPSALGLFDIIVEEKDNKTIIKINVASGSEKPYFYTKFGMTPKGSFIRIGTSAEQLSQLNIDNLFSRRTRNSISKIKSNVQELSFSQLKIYYEEIDIELPKQFAQNLELLTEEKKYNYVAYLLSDKNNISFKVAKYLTDDRSKLIENNEYGYESLVKATKQVLGKLELENSTFTEITSKERKQHQLWNAIAIREAVINAFVHNDYSKEVSPKFELFSDRIEITSAGGLPEGLNEIEFFEGFSVPRNKELIRIFKDLQLVEQLGSGIPRILSSYSKESFKFSDNFLRMTFPFDKNIGGPIGWSNRWSNRWPNRKFKNITERQKEILNLIQINPKISRPKISEKTNINKSAIQKHLNFLKEKGYIERIGGNRGYWKINIA